MNESVDIEMLIGRYRQSGSIADRNAVILAAHPMVISVAAKLAKRLPSAVDVSDLESDGIFGMLAAIDSFDPTRDARFRTFASYRIKGSMLDSVRRRDQVPRLVRARTAKWEAEVSAFAAKHGRSPSNSEVVTSLQLKSWNFRKVVADSRTRKTESLSARRIEVREGIFVAVTLADTHSDPQADKAVAKAEFMDSLARIMQGLCRQDQLIIKLRYIEGFSMEEIGKVIGLSQTSVWQLHEKLVRRLRASAVLADWLPKGCAA